MARVISLVDRAVLPLPKFKKVAAYARVSSGKDEMIHSLSSQISHYSSMIQNHPGWEYAGVYSDKAYTGTKANRPDFGRLLNDCKSGKIDMVICKSITRFARNTVDTLIITRELKELGVDVYFEQERIHSISAEGELMLSILASYAQEESRVVSENCKWRFRNKFKNGEIANLRFLYGYKISKNGIEIDEENSLIVKWIFKQYAEGTGCTKIAKTLRELNVPTLRGGKWTANSVRNILLNEKYSGNALLQKSFVEDHLTKKEKKNRGELPMYYAQNTHQPIVEQDIFQKTNKILEENRQKVKSDRKTPQKYVFTGKIKCLNCGKNYKRRIYQGKIYWSCATYVQEGQKVCSSKQIPEQILVSKTSEILGINDFSEEIFGEKIKQIIVPKHEHLTFVFNDGEKVKITWKNPSRRESWTDEKRQMARERAINFLKKGK